VALTGHRKVATNPRAVSDPNSRFDRSQLKAPGSAGGYLQLDGRYVMYATV